MEEANKMVIKDTLKEVIERKANAKGRMRRVQTILVECNGRMLTKQIIHYRFC